MEIELPDYKKIASQVKKRKVEVFEKEVEEALYWLQKSRAKFSLKNSPCQKGDWVEIEYWSTQIENGVKRKDAFILGRGQLVPGFEENLAGMEIGQEKEFQLTFPENHYQKDLAGGKVNFKAKINSIQKVEFPEVNDQFAQNLGNFQNLEGLKKSIKEGLNLEKERAESQRVRQAILDKISQNTEIKIPEILVEEEKRRMLESFKKQVPQLLQISFEDYLVKINKTEKTLMDSFSREAQQRINNSLILKEIGEREKVEVSEKEVEEELARQNFAKQNLGGLDREKIKDYIKEVIKNEKVFQFLESLTK